MIKKVILVDGVFDPIHEGHIEYLNKASKLGDKLILNLASDNEVWEKRPDLGPFLTYNARKSILQNLKAVEKVVGFDTLEALKKIKPNIYVKGDDWKNKLPNEELEYCKKNRIKINYLNTKLNSSTGILERFLKRIENGR